MPPASTMDDPSLVSDQPRSRPPSPRFAMQHRKTKALFLHECRPLKRASFACKQQHKVGCPIDSTFVLSADYFTALKSWLRLVLPSLAEVAREWLTTVCSE